MLTTQTQPMTQTKSLFSSIRAVLPETQIAALIDLRETTSAVQWQAGDLVNSIYMQVMAHNVQASIMDVCFFVSDEIYNLFAPNTLRIYSAVAKFYPVYARTGVYSFWMYRYATRFAEDWARVFSWANDFMDKHARQPYEREVRAYFEPAGELLQQVQTPCAEQDHPQLPQEIQDIEDAAVTHACKSTLRVMVGGLLNLIPSVLGELKDPEASRLLSQIGAMARQLLEQYL
jgi:hypothetical protein